MTDRIELDDEERDPWDRQPKETPRQYGRFCAYLQMGRARTLRATAKILRETGDQITVRSLYQVSSLYRWAERAEAWDLGQDKADLEKLRLDRQDMIERHRRIATKLERAAIKALDRLEARNYEEVTMGDVVRALKLGTDLERIALGDQPAQQPASQPAGTPVIERVSMMTPEERKQRLRDLTEEMAARAGLKVGPMDTP
jgi:hypothetical protein